MSPNPGRLRLVWTSSLKSFYKHIIGKGVIVPPIPENVSKGSFNSQANMNKSLFTMPDIYTTLKCTHLLPSYSVRRSSLKCCLGRICELNLYHTQTRELCFISAFSSSECHCMMQMPTSIVIGKSPLMMLSSFLSMCASSIKHLLSEQDEA